MAIVVSKNIVQQYVEAILMRLQAPDNIDDLLCLADEAYHQISSLKGLLTYAVHGATKDCLELNDTLELLELAITRVEHQFDKAVDEEYFKRKQRQENRFLSSQKPH